jgi:hypothetical protein
VPSDGQHKTTKRNFISYGKQEHQRFCKNYQEFPYTTGITHSTLQSASSKKKDVTLSCEGIHVSFVKTLDLFRLDFVGMT